MIEMSRVRGHHTLFTYVPGFTCVDKESVFQATFYVGLREGLKTHEGRYAQAQAGIYVTIRGWFFLRWRRGGGHPWIVGRPLFPVQKKSGYHNLQ